MSLNALNIYKLRVLLKLYYRSENPAFFLRKPPTKKQHFFVWYKNLSNIQDDISCHSYIELFLMNCYQLSIVPAFLVNTPSKEPIGTGKIV